MKIVVNECFGGWHLSDVAVKLIKERTGIDLDANPVDEEDLRWRPEIVRVVEELGDKASATYSKLVVEEVDDRYNYFVTYDDGWEEVRYRADEEYLRHLVRNGDEEAVLEYVRRLSW